MDKSKKSPRITSLSWGKIVVEGYPPYKDVKVYPGGSRGWNWDETGTRHAPGIQPADVEELLANGAEVLVLSKGMYGRLQVCTDTIHLLEERGIPVHLKKTKDAVRIYNELRETELVGGLFHSTC
ncbi:MAG: Mth938-like domain-containing protein [Fidelibacterota bacterium]|nr:MAG: Mth938-like domain-containing protein [Candidatus Neomarinimicrobiota bacterium]